MKIPLTKGFLLGIERDIATFTVIGKNFSYNNKSNSLYWKPFYYFNGKRLEKSITSIFLIPSLKIL